MIQRYTCPSHVRQWVQLKHWELIEEKKKTEKNPLKLDKQSRDIVLKSCLFFFPQLLEFLFRATLQLYPGDRPLWLQPTRLNFKDHWTIFSVAGSALFCVHRMAADRHASFPTHWKAHGQGERGHRRCQRCRYSKGLEWLWEIHPHKPSFWSRHWKYRGTDSILYQLQNLGQVARPLWASSVNSGGYETHLTGLLWGSDELI